MLEHTLRVLEFDKVIEFLKERAISPLGDDGIKALEPSTDLIFLKKQLELVSELRNILIIEGSFPIRGVKDVRSYYKRIEIEGSFLEPTQLLNMALTLEVIRGIKNFLKRRQESYPHLFELSQIISPFRGIESKIYQVISNEGEVKDDATPKLSKIRRNFHRVRAKIQHKLEQIISSDVAKGAIQDSVITLRDDRFVIPVKSSMRGKVKGIIHDESGSGSTVFVEPFATVKLNNELRELQIEERKEIERILKEVTALVRESLPEIKENIFALQEYEVIYAKARLAQDLDCYEPALNNENYLCLEHARHPILEMNYRFGDIWQKQGNEEEKRPVIPLDLYLDQKRNTVVITGPNTGGKTVALKTLGLMCLMAQCGMHIPAGMHTELPIFEQIFADIGDEQSIEQNLSTFSSHMTHIVQIIEKADNSTLVLVDEVGAGTDPDQGAALGMAILEDLTVRGTMTVATTHYGSLKAFAHEHAGIQNACMEFDSKTLQPTYRLLMGVPGSSKAFEIAKRLGMPKQITNRAAHHLGGDELEIGSLITDLQEQMRIIREKREGVEQKEQEIEEILAVQSKKMSELKNEVKQIKKEALEEAERIVQSSNALVERTIANLKKTQADKNAIEEAREEIKQEKKKIEKSLAKFKHKAKPKAVAKPTVGQKVMVDKFNREGIIETEPDKDGNVRVTIGNIHTEIHVSDISIINDDEKHKKTITTTKLEKSFKLELDLRGMTFEDAEVKIEKYFDDALISGIKSVRIIHGKGTGALRRKVGKMLDHHSLVKSHRLADQNIGGAGVTEVTLVD